MQADAGGRSTLSTSPVEKREWVTNVSFREVSHDRRDSIEFNGAIFTTEQLKYVVPVECRFNNVHSFT